MVRVQLLRRKVIPGGLQHLMREVALDTPVEADLQFVNSAHRVSSRENIQKYKGHVTFYVPGAHDFLSAMNFH